MGSTSTTWSQDDLTAATGASTTTDDVTISGDLTVGGSIVEGRTIIKILPTDFKCDSGGGAAVAQVILISTSTNYGIKTGNGAVNLWTWVDIPTGYTATKVVINGENTNNPVEVYTIDLDDGTIGSEISNSGLTVGDDTVLSSNHVGADDKALLIKVDVDGTGDVIYGGYVTIEQT